MLTLGVACYRRYDLLLDMIRSAEEGARRPDRYYLIDNGGIANSDVLPRNMEIFRPGRNIGVAAAVNQLFRANDDLTVWANDDVLFERATLGELESAALADPARLFLVPEHNAGSAFTVFLARKALFEKVGWFDECFYPAYFEDNDFGYRMQLAGIERHYVAAKYYHHQSATIQTFSHEEMQQHHASFDANKHRYRMKWGGEPGREVWKEPKA